jgi:hypothetical protein
MTRERTGPVINIVLRVEWWGSKNYLLDMPGTLAIDWHVGHLEHEFLLFYVRLLLVD